MPLNGSDAIASGQMFTGTIDEDTFHVVVHDTHVEVNGGINTQVIWTDGEDHFSIETYQGSGGVVTSHHDLSNADVTQEEIEAAEELLDSIVISGGSWGDAEIQATSECANATVMLAGVTIATALARAGTAGWGCAAAGFIYVATYRNWLQKCG